MPVGQLFGGARARAQGARRRALDAATGAVRLLGVVMNRRPGELAIVILLVLAHCTPRAVDAPAGLDPTAPEQAEAGAGGTSSGSAAMTPDDGVPELEATPDSPVSSEDEVASCDIDLPEQRAALQAAPCEDVLGTSSLALDALTPLGFTPNDVLPFALGPHRVPLDWLAPVYSEGGTLLDYAVDGTSDILIEVTARSAEARVIEQGDARTSWLCRYRVEVDVEVRLESGDGALRERLDGTLDLSAGMVSLTASLPVDAIQGSFAFEPAELSGLAPTALGLKAAFTRYGFDGRVSRSYGTESVSQSLYAARWPTWGDCASLGIPLLDDRDGLVDAAVRFVLGTERSLTLVNSSGVRAPVEATLTPVANAACFLPAGINGESYPGEMDTLRVPAELTLSSSALPAPLRVALEVQGSRPPGAALESAALSLALLPCAQSAYTPADFRARCGDWGIDASGYDAASLEVYESRFDAQSGYAEFVVSGLTSPGCAPSLDGLVCDECWNGDVDLTRLGSVRIFRDGT